MSELLKKEEENKLTTEPEAEGDEEGDGPVPEEESTATFAPIVVLQNVEIKTHEEEEDIVYQQRAKLFEYGELLLDKGTGKKQWNERGVGEIKFLKHKETSRIRILMRQEKIMKILINQFLDPRVVMVPNATNEKSWIWNSFDFSDGELVEKTFCVRFNNVEATQEFKKQFDICQESNRALLSGKDKAPAEGAAEEGEKEKEEATVDEAVSAIESVTLKEGEEKPATPTTEN